MWWEGWQSVLARSVDKVCLILKWKSEVLIGSESGAIDSDGDTYSLFLSL